jgi:transcriptional regulator with XRE-family HTH domain
LPVTDNTYVLTNKETNMFPESKIEARESTMAKPLLQQLKKRRLTLGLKQCDMMMRIGISRQQYNRLETTGNPRLVTLELIAKGVNCELLLVPREKLRDVIDVLERGEPDLAVGSKQTKKLCDDPWQNILGEDL